MTEKELNTKCGSVDLKGLSETNREERGVQE